MLIASGTDILWRVFLKFKVFFWQHRVSIVIGRMASDFETVFYVVLIGLVYAKGSEANGRPAQRDFGIQVPEDYRRRCRIAIAAAVAAVAAAGAGAGAGAAAAAAVASIRGRSHLSRAVGRRCSRT